MHQGQAPKILIRKSRDSDLWTWALGAASGEAERHADVIRDLTRYGYLK